MSIGYKFTPLPKGFIQKVFQSNLSKNQLLVIWGIAEEIFSFPETRETLTRELSYRYLANKVKISYQAVYSAIHKLIKKGFIQIVRKGKDKVGSIIKLIADIVIENVTKDKVTKSITKNEKKIVTEIITNQKSVNPERVTDSIATSQKTLVIESITKDNFLVTESITNKEPLPLKKQQNPPGPQEEVVVLDNEEEEETVESVRLQIEESMGRKIDWEELERN